MLLTGGNRLTANEPLELPPREAEVLAVMPRVTTAAPVADPDWLYRGSIRPGGTFESPLPNVSNETNRRQIELLRALDKLRLFKSEDDLDIREGELGSIADKLGKPEVLVIPPRTVK